jgi:hypothetical protein
MIATDTNVKNAPVRVLTLTSSMVFPKASMALRPLKKPLEGIIKRSER